MAIVVTHSTPADGTFSAEGAIAWEAEHVVSGATLTEVEVDFGTKPRWDKKFEISDAAFTPSSKVIALESGKTATGRKDGDAQWDSISCAVVPATGSAIVYCVANPGPVVGKRTIQYEVR